MNFRKIFFNFESFIFIASQLLVGFLNYLFQLYASQTLPVVEFGHWAQWLAKFSVAGFAGIWLQSLSSIGSIEHFMTLKKSRWALFFVSAAWILSFLLQQEVGIYIFGWLAALISGFWFGVHLRTRQMKLLAFATLSGHACKFLWVQLDLSSQNFYHATALAPLLISTCFLTLSKHSNFEIDFYSPKLKMNLQLLLASLSLAFFVTWVPQVDLLVVPKLLSDMELGIFAKVALLYKGFFFCFQVLAQILLSHQVQSKNHRLGIRPFLIIGSLGAFAAFTSLAVAAYFDWPYSWTALSLLHVTSLCLIFLIIQDQAARHKGAIASFLCLLSIGLAFSLSRMIFEIRTYWLIALFSEILIVSFFVMREAQSDRWPQRPNRLKTS